MQDTKGICSALLICPHRSFSDDLPRAEDPGASEAAERLGRGCVWDVAGEDGHHWRVFRTGQREQRVDMTVIEPYKKVLSHGGNSWHKWRGKNCDFLNKIPELETQLLGSESFLNPSSN